MGIHMGNQDFDSTPTYRSKKKNRRRSLWIFTAGKEEVQSIVLMITVAFRCLKTTILIIKLKQHFSDTVSTTINMIIVV